MDKIIFFAILVLFPFGQILKFGFINLFDIVVFVLAVVTLWRKPVYPYWYKYFIYFILTCIFSLLLNYKLIDLKGVLYLVRLVSYSLIAVYVSNFLKDRKLIHSALISISVASAIFGWLQYFIWPDLTSLKYLGWDDHLLRIIGTFLDPTYLGLILVLGIILALYNKCNKVFYFLAFSILFTYSRISYLLLFLVSFINKKYLAIIFFALAILFLPKNIGEGTTLERTSSTNLKLINYKETIQIFNKSPLWGVGFNNICNARILYLNDQNSNSHACNGSDSSILFLLATTGIVGLILFINFILHVPNNQLFRMGFVVVLVHSLFANSLFYPHIMFWLFCLIGLQTEVNSKGG